MERVNEFYRSLTDDQRHEMMERLDEIVRSSVAFKQILHIPRELLMLAYQAGQQSVTTPRVYFHVGDAIKNPVPKIPLIKSDNEAVLPKALFSRVANQISRVPHPDDVVGRPTVGFEPLPKKGPKHD